MIDSTCPIRNMRPCEWNCALYDEDRECCSLTPAKQEESMALSEIAESFKALNLKVDALYKILAKRN